MNISEQAEIAGNGGVSRRTFLVASGGLLLPSLIWSEGRWNSMLCWKLDSSGETAKETNTEANSPISSRTGHAIWVGNGRDRALRLDGYSAWIIQQDAQLRIETGRIALCAWMALESYPVNDAAIIDLDFGTNRRLRLSLDRLGYMLMAVDDSNSKISCKSSRPVQKAEWRHVGAVLDESAITLYVDGAPCGRQSLAQALSLQKTTANVTLGKSPDCPVVAGVFPTGVLNGLLRDVRVLDGAPSEHEFSQMMAESRPVNSPDLQINGYWCASDPHRPLYHAIPPRAWTNEPHGLIHWSGQYHLFYQKNPNGPYWGHINWGHMASPDLYNWTEMPVALSPEPGPDNEGCWSGSVIDHNGTLAILYTGGDGHRASICLAESEDGVHFIKYAGNPVIPEPPQGHGFPEFRDPFVWREGEKYYLIIGSAVAERGGTALLYRSQDLIRWEFLKPLLIGDRETSGVFWEMPVFLNLGGQHALIVCEVPGRASYWIGTWKDETFTPNSPCPQRLELFNHLLSPTPLMLEDGRIVTMGIVPDERRPKECWRAGWAHHYSLPRLITVDAAGRLHQSVFDGINRLCEQGISLSNVELPEDSMKQIEQASGTSLNLRMLLTRGDSRSVKLRLLASPDLQEHTDIIYQWDIGRLALDRTHSTLDSDVMRDIKETTYFPDQKDSLELDIYLDQSALEIFLDQRSAFAAHIYPTLAASTAIYVGGDGTGAKIDTLTIRQIKRPR